MKQQKIRNMRPEQRCLAFLLIANDHRARYKHNIRWSARFIPLAPHANSVNLADTWVDMQVIHFGSIRVEKKTGAAAKWVLPVVPTETVKWVRCSHPLRKIGEETSWQTPRIGLAPLIFRWREKQISVITPNSVESGIRKENRNPRASCGSIVLAASSNFLLPPPGMSFSSECRPIRNR